MKHIRLLIIFTILAISGIGGYSAFAAYNQVNEFQDVISTDTISVNSSPQTKKDAKPRFSVKKTSIEEYKDLQYNNAADLKTPENIKSEIEYDYETGCYIMRTRVAGMDISTPMMLTAKEYNDYSLRKSMQAYYHEKNNENIKGGKKKFDIFDMQFNIGPLDKVFGPGGVKITTQGSAELMMSIKTNKTDNPALSMEARKKTYFDFDEKIQANIKASVGDKLNFSMNYNTDATFSFDSQKLNLKYEGEEDQIIKSIEAGNVSMNTNSSLIQGGTSLFGIKTKLQFGKLTMTALVSQQEAESKKVNSKNGTQLTEFALGVDKYDENRHFFIAHNFRDNYETSVAKLPYISSGVTINRIEVWVTNKKGSYGNARNLIAFADLGEEKQEHISNSHWKTTGYRAPANDANTLYKEIVNSYPEARNISLVGQVLAPLESYGITGGKDYVKIESARRLEASEYSINTQLGYISLNQRINADEVIAVAYEYTKNGEVFQVGEFAADISDASSSLIVKMLKSTTVMTSEPIWDLMMKNIYSLEAYQIQKDKFKLQIYFRNDTSGTQVTYMSLGDIKGKQLIKVMNLDRLDSKDEPNPDGVFDYVENYTVTSSKGRIIFPVLEPFGSHLKKMIGGSVPDVDKYIYQELYDSTQTVARQFTDKNKFTLQGQYKASSGNTIQLNSMNVARGSVKVTAGGVTLVENVDYTVDYTMGTVTIINQSYADAGSNIQVSLESQEMFNMQRKTLVGLDLNYDFTKNFRVGATIMHMGEKALTEKLSVGNEVINNTIWGVNTSYTTEFQWLTNWVNRIPMVNATAPSKLTINAEFAQLIPSTKQSKAVSYIDDFEYSQSQNDIRLPYAWNLASTPSMFAESKLSNDVGYGKNRALFAWYYIDRLFTQKNSNLTPVHIKNDLDQLSNHYVREVLSSEVFPNRELSYGESSLLQVLNLSFYPTERGPYSLDASAINPDGSLQNPEMRWGGIMRKMDNTDFESANIEYLQFWMLDPFIYDKDNGGYLYFNFGEISEDILRDGKKSFENGLPTDGNNDMVENTVWGKVSRQQSVTYAFDNNSAARAKQDVGLNGLSTEEEQNYDVYKNYVNQLRNVLSQETQQRYAYDQFSPFNDPAGDNYHFYRGSDYDDAETSILERYKHYNGTEGNSISPDEASDSEYQSSRSVPDVEDINQDNTLDEYERYYQYGIKITPEDLVVGRNYITAEQESSVALRNGETTTVKWYQFKIPLKEVTGDGSHMPRETVGSIQDFKTIRFARMFMTGFKKDIHLRLASLELVRGDWRSYNLRLHNDDKSGGTTLPAEGDLDVSVVNIEENAGQKPVNYVLPPGVTRIISPDQSQITQLNEQSISLKVTNLPSKNARAIYKTSGLDVRNYERLQMFVHAEKLIDDKTNVKDGEISVFVRIGSDIRSNYYEYEVPLKLTPEGNYNTYNTNDQESVWPESNMIDFPLALLTEAKKQRNSAKSRGEAGVSFGNPYSIYDPEKKTNRVTVVGNPSVSNMESVVIGVRNNSASTKDIIVWVNEMRLSGFKQDGGWGFKADANLNISDLATIAGGTHIETAGFGGVDQTLNDRRLEDYYQYNFSFVIDAGRFLPEKVKLKAPLYYSYFEERNMPKYNPLDEDVLMDDALEACVTETEKDSIKNIAIDRSRTRSFSLTGFKFDIQSKNPMPWDPANFTMSYSSNKQDNQSITTQFENSKDRRFNLNYTYTPYVKPWQPFAKLKSKSKHLDTFKEMAINYVPNSITFSTNISRMYNEQQERNIENDASAQIPVSVNKNFYWDRQFSIQWNILRCTNLSFSSMTNAHIDEPSGVVNKTLFPDEFKAWKDTVTESILKLGTPWKYNQSFNASVNLPLSKSPILDWINLQGTYAATYSWDRGAFIDENTIIGNTINNNAQLGVTGKFNFETLYNKSKYLKEVNRKFSSSSKGSRSSSKKKTTSRSSATKKNQSKNTFEQKITLSKDSGVVVQHNLDTKKLRIVGRTEEGKLYTIKYKALNKNSIRINNLDSVNITVKVSRTVPVTNKEDSKAYKAGEYLARFAMMLRNVNVQYKHTSSMTLPSFTPGVSDILGQNTATSSLSPGLDFAFGMPGEGYIDKAINKGWLITGDSSLVSPAISMLSKDLMIDATLEPIKGLKITLTATYSKSNNNQIQFMFDGRPTTRGGNFSMTTVGMQGIFKGMNANKGYQSENFDNFLAYRDIIAGRVENAYSGVKYPSAKFINDKMLNGKPYNAANGGVKKSSSDVMIPAFLAAYTGRDANTIELTAFPSMKRILPNWRITYDGLSKLKKMKEHFKSFTFTHAYSCVYSVGSFTSFLNWVDAGDGYGFVKDEQTGAPLPSSPYDIGSVVLTESFNPLLGIDMTLRNSVSVRSSYKDSRTVTLNPSSGQIVESSSRELSIGAGYTFVNFKFGKGNARNAGGFSSDLKLQADISYRTSTALIRKIEEYFTQATSGAKTFSIKISANYAVSRMLTLKAFYDHQINTPLISSTSYPTTDISYGIAVQLNLSKRQ
ncbi:MAG: cell surface protein SprA [Bacteroidales bacterium]|nr:cell surface protein SprA [Bacteroidales bacterium]